MMSSNSWQASLSRLLRRPEAEAAGRTRLAIVGIGNDQRGDDVAGILVARRLAALARNGVLVVDGGDAPENVTGILRRSHPSFVVLVDAAEMGERPGTVCWIDRQQIDGMSASTHSLPLSMLADYLTLELGCQVSVLGIQPESNELGGAVSPAVRRAVEEVVGEFARPDLTP